MGRWNRTPIDQARDRREGVDHIHQDHQRELHRMPRCAAEVEEHHSHHHHLRTAAAHEEVVDTLLPGHFHILRVAAAASNPHQAAQEAEVVDIRSADILVAGGLVVVEELDTRSEEGNRLEVGHRRSRSPHLLLVEVGGLDSGYCSKTWFFRVSGYGRVRDQYGREGN